jgi:hypothetical protein
MDDQCLTCCSGLFNSPLREWPEYFALIIAAVEVAPIWKNSYYVESHGIPDNGDHLLFALNSDTWSLGNFFPRSEPNRFMVGTIIESQLVQGYNVMPGSLFLDLEHPEQRRRQFNASQFLSVSQKRQYPAKMTSYQPKSVD